jgi:hypothetical protein
VKCPPLKIASASPLPDGQARKEYKYQLEASGGQSPIKYELLYGPPGLTVSPSGLVSGVLPVSAIYSFDVRATDSCTSEKLGDDRKTFSLKIKEVPPATVPSKLPIATQPATTGALLKADIAITDIFFDSSCNLHVKNTNTGNIQIKETLRQKIWVNGTLTDDSTSMIDLAPNASVEKIVKTSTIQNSPLTPSPSVTATLTITAKAAIDADNKLQETNEANNTMTKTLSCTRR